MSLLATPAPQRFEVARSIGAERRSTLALLRTLPATAFDAPATPGWRVRDVVAHLITLDRAAVLGTLLPLALGRSTDRLERWNDRAVPSWADRPVPALLAGLEAWGRRFGWVTRTIPRRLYRTRIRSLWGRTPFGLVLWIRAYDEWVHRQDIRRALGMADEEVDVASVAEFVLHVATYDSLPRLDGRTGRVAVALRGAPVLPWVYDLGAGTGTPTAEPDGDALISVPAPAFVMAAAGRDPFDALRAAEELRIEGDADLAAAFLDALRIV